MEKNDITHLNMFYIDFNKYMNQSDRYYSFNFSVISLGDNHYLYAVRVIKLNDQSLEVIPDNSKDCKQHYEVGTNYWWNNWNNSNKFRSYTAFFIGYNKNITQLKVSVSNDSKPTKHYDVSYTDGYFLNFEDVRIAQIRGKNYLYSNDTKLICELYVNTGQIIPKQLYMVIPYVYLQGINQVILDIHEVADVTSITYIDWYHRDYVSIFSVDLVDKQLYFEKPSIVKITHYDISYIMNIDGGGSYVNDKEEDIQYFGINYGVVPKLSFGCPCIKINNYSNNYSNNDYIGVGHIKIYSDTLEYPYINGSNIDIFRKNLYRDYKRHFGDKYIRHTGTGSSPSCIGYIYMLYFYTIQLPSIEDEAIMYISDAYLPLSINDNEYKFSLIYPMGITYNENMLIVSCGEGDFYSVLCEFRLDEVIDACKYNIKNVDFNNYNYSILS